MLRCFSPFIALVAGAALVASCDASGPGPGVERAEGAAQFSDADKSAARALSISNDSALDTVETPYAEALLCSVAIGSLADRFRDSDALSAQQRAGFVQAERFFRDRARTIAGRSGVSPAEFDAQLRDARVDDPDDPAGGRRARAAIACLQKLL